MKKTNKRRSVILEARGKQFDPEIVTAFEELKGELKKARHELSMMLA